MKNFEKWRTKFGMTGKLAALALGVVLVLGFASCKIDVEKIVEVEKIVVDKKADETAPAAVTDLTATAKDSRVLLTWTDAADSDIYGYEVSYSGSGAINRVVLPALNTTSMMVPQGAGGTYVSGLTNDTEYTFTVKSVDTSGNKSECVTVTATPVAADASETLKIALTAAVPHENGYTGNKSNTKVTVTASITTASNVKKVVYKKNGSLIAKTLLTDAEATVATASDDNAVWTIDITATDESANGTYTVAAIDEAGREEAEQITIDNFDFTPPAKIKVTSDVYSSELKAIILNWTEPDDSDYDHVSITFTSNDGTSNSEPSQAVSVTKGTTNKTFSSIDGAKAYYTYIFVTYDKLGNEGATYTYKVNIPKGFVKVTGGTFDGTGTLTPESEVFISGRSLTIGDLWVSDHEVTQKEYSAYMINYGEAASNDNYRWTDTYGKGDDYPAYYVNWYEAVIYCNLRSMAEGLTPAYYLIDYVKMTDPVDWMCFTAGSNIKKDASGKYYYNATVISSVLDYNGETDEDGGIQCDFTANGYRLPTEAEWEYIARGGSEWKEYTYSGSNKIDDVTWYNSNSDYKTHEVKTKAANSLGIYDMSGNIREWCYNFSCRISRTPWGDLFYNFCVHRGGCWFESTDTCTVADRMSDTTCYRENFLGFRVVRNAQ